MKPIVMHCPETGQKTTVWYPGDHTRFHNLGWLEGPPPAKPTEPEVGEELYEDFDEPVFNYDPESD